MRTIFKTASGYTATAVGRAVPSAPRSSIPALSLRLAGPVCGLLLLPGLLHAQPRVRMPGDDGSQWLASRSQRESSRWESPWAKWSQQPAVMNLGANASVMAQPGTYFIIKAGGVCLTNEGYGCSSFTNVPQVQLNLVAHQPTRISVEGGNVARVQVELIAPAPVDLRAARTRRGRPTTPTGLKVFINGVDTNRTDHVNGAGCVAYTNSWTLELRPDEDALRRNTLGPRESSEVAEGEAPGDGTWPEIGPGKNILLSIAPVRWSVGLGRLYSGKSAGRVYYIQNGLSSNSYTAGSLVFEQAFTNHTQVTVITNSSVSNALVLRQIRTPQAFLDIPTNTVNSFELRFYPLSHVSTNINTNSGCYDILTNSPFVIWRFTNTLGNPNTPNKLRVVEERPGLSWTSDIEYNSTNRTWSLSRGTGSEKYLETRALCLQTNVVLDQWGDPVQTNFFRLETNRVSDAAGKVAYEALETYQQFKWGWELVSSVVDPATNALTTTFEYYTNSWPDVNREKLKRTIYPDGSWELREYARAIENDDPIVLNWVFKPHKDTGTNATPTDENSIKFDYRYDRVPETGEIFVREVSRYAPTNKLYRYDTTKKVIYGVTEGLERETYQLGWLPDCMGAKVREGVLRFRDDALPEAWGHLAMTLTNYVLGMTNTYETGTWSSGSFTPGTGPAWRKSSVYGRGSLYDSEDPDQPPDRVSTIPGKSFKQTEIRQDGVVVCAEFYAYSGSVIDGTTFALVFRDFYTNDLLGRPIARTRVDAQSSVQRILRTADWKGTNQFPGSLLLSETDENGLTVNYTYDSLKRLKTRTTVGASGLPDYAVTFTYDACGRTLSATTNAGSLSLSNQFAYDRAGRLTKIIDHAGLTTTYAYPSNGLITCITNPGGATYISTRFLSGEPKSETGTAVVQKYFDHQYFNVDQNQGITIQKHTNALSRTAFLASQGSARKQTTYFNLWDFPAWEVLEGHWGPITNRHFYANRDDNLTCLDTPGTGTNRIQNYQAYDTDNHPHAAWLFVDGSQGQLITNLAPNEVSKDRLTKTFAVYTNISGAWFRVTNSFVYLTDGSGAATRVSETRERLNGFASGVKTEMVTIDPDTNTFTETVYVDRAAKKATQVVASPSSTLPATNIFVNGLRVSESTHTVAKPAVYSYDALRRQTQATTPAGAATSLTYDTATGRVSAATDFAGNTTTYEYYPGTHLNAGRLKCQTAANGKKTYYEYTARGELYRTWGDVPYPEERAYSEYGELVTLKTYRGGSGWSGSSWPASPGTADTTTWTYQSSSGLLLQKTDAASAQMSYIYHTNNQLFRRVWARAVNVTNTFNPWGDLERLNYSDGTASVVFTNYNRAGLPRSLSDASGSHALLYDHALRLVSDKCTNGTFNGIVVSNHFHQIYGRDYVRVEGTTPALQHNYSFDTFGRLASVAHGVYSAAYGYLPDSDRLQSTICKSNTTTVLTTTRTWDWGERLRSIANLAGTGSTPSLISSHAYLYDAVHRRTQATLEDSSLWKYDYNDRDEVVSGKRYWPDWSPVSGQQFEYAFDNIGNRTSAKSGGDVNGGTLRTSTYTANSLNQYTQVATPGYENILGVALATNSVTVNSSTADRKVEYFHREITVANGSGPLWQSVTVSSGSSSTNGGLAFPASTQTLAYDSDGNLTFDGIWAYRWDGENRLIEMTMTNIASVPNVQRKRLQFAYDFQGRRVSKAVSTWTGSAFGSPVTTRFAYDGWNLLAELDASANVLRGYAWGLDLSGTMDQAGGIGGLLAVAEHGAAGALTNHFVGYDGNGNVMALLKADGAFSARYEYSPFGEGTRVSGLVSRINPFRWSTKFGDDESGLLYYGHRYYSANLGRWTSRDPIEEEGGQNLYGFVSNSPLTWADPDGSTRVNFGTQFVAALAALITSISDDNPHQAQFGNRAQMDMQKLIDDLGGNPRPPVPGTPPGSGFPPTASDRFTRGDWVMSKLRRGSKFAGRLAGPLGVMGTLMGAQSSAAAIADSAESYARNLAAGDIAMADLDALTIAIEVQNIGEDYFVTSYVLGILLTN